MNQPQKLRKRLLPVSQRAATPPPANKDVTKVKAFCGIILQHRGKVAHSFKAMDALLYLLNTIHPLSPALKEYLILHLQCREVRKKDFILRAGHVSRHIYFIERGLLRCFYLQDQQEVCSWFMKEGDVICSVESFFDQKESYESIQALEDCTLHYISYGELYQAYAQFPEFNFIGRELVQRYYKLSEQRLYSLRMQRGLERFENLKKFHPELVARVEQKFLASYLGITEQYLSMIKGVGKGRRNG